MWGPFKTIRKQSTKLIICIFLVFTVHLLWSTDYIFNTGDFWSITRHKLASFLYIQNMLQASRLGSQANYSSLQLDDFMELFQSRYNKSDSLFALKSDESYHIFLKRLSLLTRKGEHLLKETEDPENTSSGRFKKGINKYHLYDPNDEQLIQDLIQDLVKLPINSSEKQHGGSQLKIGITLSDGSKARVKLMRRPREVETTTVNTHQVHELERHVAEIAGFHLDRLLGFYKAVPTVGRVFNMTRDLTTFLSNPKFVMFMYRSPAGNLCFAAHCLQKCGPDYPYCGHPDLIEGAVSAELPPINKYHQASLVNPYSRSYSKSRAVWEDDENYCRNRVMNHTSLIGSRTLLDLIDLSILDYLTGNGDRHHFKMFSDLGNDSFILHFDNGRGFGMTTYDNHRSLAPIFQCCLIRLSTLAKLMKLYQGPESLSHVMRESMKSDPVSPVLIEPHLDGLDRRLAKTIKAVSDCINIGRAWDGVVIDDGFV